MPRSARSQSLLNMYHVGIRGADRQLLFVEPNDFRKYLDILLFYKQEFHFFIFAFCLMSNHVHIVLFSPESTLETIFRHVNTAYAQWFNMKYQRTGFLLQGRYFSEPINSERQLFAAIRYVHQNPIKAGLERFVGSDYLWSSIWDYKRGLSELVDITQIQQTFGDPASFLQAQSLPSEEEFWDVEKLRKRLPDDVARQIISEISDCSTPVEFQSLPMKRRNHCLFLIHEKGVSVRQLNRLTGIPRGIVERAVGRDAAKPF